MGIAGAGFATFAIVFLVLVVFFIIIRGLNLWYWRINDIVYQLALVNENLKMIHDLGVVPGGGAAPTTNTAPPGSGSPIAGPPIRPLDSPPGEKPVITIAQLAEFLGRPATVADLEHLREEDARHIHETELRRIAGQRPPDPQNTQTRPFRG